MKLCIEKWWIGVDFLSYTIGLGWWKTNNKIVWRLLSYDYCEYDSASYWGLRLGPLYMLGMIIHIMADMWGSIGIGIMALSFLIRGEVEEAKYIWDYDGIL